MSFIFRPVGGGEMMTKEDIVRRSASRPHVKQTQGGKPPAHSMPLKDLVCCMLHVVCWGGWGRGRSKERLSSRVVMEDKSNGKMLVYFR